MSIPLICNCPHGYIRYTHGCRCGVCRKAKAEYSRQRRATARSAAADRSADLSFTHGTRFGYEERGCRCRPCLTARRTRGEASRAARWEHTCTGCGYRWALCACPGGPRGGAS